MDTQKLMSKEEADIIAIQLQEVRKFLKENNIKENSKTGQLLIDFSDILRKKFVEYL
ncbi:hypothetical protein ACQ7AI_11820 [Lactococcus petauri]